MSHGKPGFWNTLFRKQPIEAGVTDRVEVDVDEVRAGFKQANDDFGAAMQAFLDAIEKRERAKGIFKDGISHS